MAERFPFTSWVYRDITAYSPTEVDRMVDCGLTLCMVPHFDYKNSRHVELLKEWLERAKARGVKLMLDADFNIGKIRVKGDRSWIDEMKNFFEVTLESHPSVYGFVVGDEPHTFEELERTKYLISEMTEVLPTLKPYINFMGSTCEFQDEVFGNKTQSEWLAELKAASGEFTHSYDMYSQMINYTGGVDFYFNECMENVDASQRAGIEPWACLICSAHQVYRAPTEYDIVWQINTAAACGFKGICWFRFYDSPVVPNYHASPIDEYGDSTVYYDQMRRSIRRFSDNYGEIFPKLKRKSTYFFGEDKKRGSYPRFEDGVHDVIEHIRCFEESLISFFEHEETGEEYFCIVDLSRVNYEHYEIFYDTDNYEVHSVYANGKRQGIISTGPRDSFWEGEWLYPGQLGLFKIVKK